MEYLKLPSNQRLDTVGRQRNASFIDESDTPDKKRNSSSTSLQNVARRTPRPSSSSIDPRSMSTGLNGYHTPVIRNDDTLELIPADLVQTIESPSSPNNSQSVESHSSLDDFIEIDENDQLALLLQDSYWSHHPFKLKRHVNTKSFYSAMLLCFFKFN